MMKGKVYKTPRTCGFSKRHFRRIVKKCMEEEIYKEKMSVKQRQKQPTNQTESEESLSSEDENVGSQKSIDESTLLHPSSIDDDNLYEETAGPSIPYLSDENVMDVAFSEEDITEQFDNYSVYHNEIESNDSERENDVIDSNSSSESENSFISDSEVKDELSTDEEKEDDDDDDDDDDDNDNLDNSCTKKKSFLASLRNWALLFHIAHVAITALLLILKSELSYSIPLDARTLMGTIRHVKISEIDGGTYHHFGVERAVRGILQEFKKKGKKIDQVKLVFNIDGLPISKSGTESLWLILCSELNGDLVYPVGAFCGTTKPNDANEFMKEFVDELIPLCKNGLEDVNVSIACECIVCDAPAKSFVFYLKGHTGYNSCSKCEIGGIYISRKLKNKKKKKGTVCFPLTKRLKLKTDKGFNRNDYKDVDDGKEPILKKIPNFGCISNVPLDYMHLVLLGVVKKIIQLWIQGPYTVRLRRHVINKISKKLNTLRYSTPSEFGRKPRSLWHYTHWKATEFRTFLLYAAPVVLKHIRRDMYDHFLLLHTAITVLVSEIHLDIPSNIDVCHEMLVRFVEDFQKIYGKQYVSHNVHNLLHLCSDVKRFGRLDKFSAFRFENYLSSIKRWIRKGSQPLEQIARRYSEREANLKDLKLKEAMTLNHPHHSGPLTGDCATVKKQYKIFSSKSFKLNCLEPKNSCVLLKGGMFGQVMNIVDCNNEVRLIIKKINCISPLYDNPDSTCINIHKGILSDDAEFSTSITNVLCKVWRIPSTSGMMLLPLQHVA